MLPFFAFIMGLLKQFHFLLIFRQTLGVPAGRAEIKPSEPDTAHTVEGKRSSLHWHPRIITRNEDIS